jgi:parvulin-like peptidyl-prolyl isomerase
MIRNGSIRILAGAGAGLLALSVVVGEAAEDGGAIPGVYRHRPARVEIPRNGSGEPGAGTTGSGGGLQWSETPGEGDAGATSGETGPELDGGGRSRDERAWEGEEALPPADSGSRRHDWERPADALPRMDPPKPRAEPAPQSAIARLDGQVISREALVERLIEEHGIETFERMLNLRLLRAEILRRGISIRSEELHAAFERHLARFREAMGEEADAETVIRETFGMTPADYRRRVVWVELALERLVTDELNITEADAFNYYWAHREVYTRPAEVRLAHILVNPLELAGKGQGDARVAGAREWRRAHEEALALLERLRAGEEFGSLAREFSHDLSTRNRGGDLGFVSRGTLPAPLEDAAFSLEPGETADNPVKTIYGYHLLRVRERTPERLPPFDRIKDRVMADYRLYMTRALSADVLRRLRERALAEGRLTILDRRLLLPKETGAATTVSGR